VTGADALSTVISYLCSGILCMLLNTRDLQIVFFLFELNLELNRPSDSFSNRIFESAIYHASRNTA